MLLSCANTKIYMHSVFESSRQMLLPFVQIKADVCN